MLPARLDAQRPDSIHLIQQEVARAHVVRWYEAATALGGVAALMRVDEPVQRFAQRNRSNTTNGIAKLALEHIAVAEIISEYLGDVAHEVRVSDPPNLPAS